MKNVLKRLESSPLVRKKIPNSAATMTQYLGYRLHNGENINAYLVHESLFYEEFVESLMELKGAQADIMKDLETIDETSESKSESAGGDSRPAYRRVPAEEPAAEQPQPAGDERPGQVPPSGQAQPSARGAGSQRARSLRSVQSQHGLNMADSFILNQFRGWRLLSGAALSSEECGDPFWHQRRISWTMTPFLQP